MPCKGSLFRPTTAARKKAEESNCQTDSRSDAGPKLQWSSWENEKRQGEYRVQEEKKKEEGELEVADSKSKEDDLVVPSTVQDSDG